MATSLSSGGNMSVRTKATPDQIRAATALYAQMRRDPSVLLERGEVRGGALKRFVRRINDIDLSKRLWMSTLASIAVVSLSLWLGLQAVSAVPVAALTPDVASRLADLH